MVVARWPKRLISWSRPRMAEAMTWRATGVGVVSATTARFGMAANYTLQAIAPVIALVFSNARAPCRPGAREGFSAPARSPPARPPANCHSISTSPAVRTRNPPRTPQRNHPGQLCAHAQVNRPPTQTPRSTASRAADRQRRPGISMLMTMAAHLGAGCRRRRQSVLDYDKPTSAIFLAMKPICSCRRTISQAHGHAGAARPE